MFVESAGVEQRLQVAQHVRRAIGVDPDAIDEIRARHMKAFLGDLWLEIVQ